MPDPLELDPAAVGLIRAGMTGDKFTTDRILTRAFEADLDGLFVAFIVAGLAGRMLVQACGSEAQPVALVDGCVNALVRDRARVAGLHLDLGLVPGFGLLSGFGFGRPSRPSRAAYALLACRLACCAARRCAAWSAARAVRPAAPPGCLALAAQARAHLPGWASESARHPARMRMTGSARVCAVAARAPRRRWRPGAGGRWRALRRGNLLRTRATIRPSSAAGRRAGSVFLPPAGRARGVGVRP